MKVSTKGRYALRIMIDLAEHNTGEYIPLMDIAKRQEISEKYLESIVSVLSKQKFVKALRGKGGGYRLAKAPLRKNSKIFFFRKVLEYEKLLCKLVTPHQNHADHLLQLCDIDNADLDFFDALSDSGKQFRQQRQ